MPECDVCVIGAGPGGYVAAIRAAQLGARTIIVEREEIGGVCLNWGCIPTKTLIYTSEIFRKLKKAHKLGLKVDGLAVDMPALIQRKNGVIRNNKAGIEALFKAHRIEVIKGDARVTAPGKVAVGGLEINARSIIVASGSSPAQIRGLETDGKRVITSTEALELTELPRKALIIGAGAIGAEFACIWNAFGVEVTMVEMLPAVLPTNDAEISRLIGLSLVKKEMDIRTETKVSRLDVTDTSVHATFEGAKATPVDVDLVLVGIGRKFHSEVVAETPGLGVEMDRRGVIMVNDRMETCVPGIYAIGDITGKTMLAHGASAEGLTAAANATGGAKKMDYRVVPACTFTSPEVAAVGQTEEQARKSGVDVKIGRFSFIASGRAAAMGETEGMVKIVADAATDEVLGVHIMGPEAGELIAAAALAMTMEATVAEIAHTIHTHPTLAEAVMEAAEDYYGLGVHTPPKNKA